jgi:hypothetical protein
LRPYKREAKRIAQEALQRAAEPHER